MWRWNSVFPFDCKVISGDDLWFGAVALNLFFIIVTLGMAGFFPFCFNEKLFFFFQDIQKMTEPSLKSKHRGLNILPFLFVFSQKPRYRQQYGKNQQHDKPQHHFLGTFKLDFQIKTPFKIIYHIIFIVEQFQISSAWGFFFRSGLLMSSKWVTKIPLMKWHNKYELWVCPPQWVTMLALEWRPEQAEFLFLPF